ncbi:EAL domain-containing protein [Arcobacter vandammei]|uniref:bifunctional diguanylate cyclase/phosphodiesterase n=1 Tax=Arcobacter vandammei TaxID=2782243 RepID=UPI0018E002CB|nr:EAL domain-containing protein [Arcobacter vandammei]
MFNSKLKKEIEELKKENHILNQYYNAAKETNIVSRGDLEGKVTYVNDKFIEVSQYTKDEVLGKPHSLLKGENNKNKFFELWKTIKGKDSWKGLLRNKKKDGTYYFVDNVISPILDENGEIIEYISFRYEVTDLVEKTVRLEKALREDVVSKIANRYSLLEDIKEVECPSIVLLDIVDFSSVNDLYGNVKGDKLLKTIAKRLDDEIRNYSNYSVYRVHSDEFAILADLEIKDEFILNVKEIIKKVTKEPIMLRDKDIFIDFRYVFSFENKEYLLESANMVKKYSKTNKDAIIYTKELELEKFYENNRSWTLKIKNAIKEDRIVPYYQAIYNTKTQKIEKYECLVRLIEDDKVYSPYFFLDIAKKSRQYLSITKIVIEKSFEYFKDKDFEFSINLTLEDISSPNMRKFILDKLNEYNIASKVVFEIVESEEIADFDEINDFIATVRRMGCKIAIDDFGSGYSNFAYLVKLKADYIKIDGSLIKDFVNNSDHCDIVTTILEFAKLQNIKTIAEFVSQKEILDKVSKVGIDYAQGFYIHEPSKTI